MPSRSLAYTKFRSSCPATSGGKHLVGVRPSPDGPPKTKLARGSSAGGFAVLTLKDRRGALRFPTHDSSTAGSALRVASACQSRCPKRSHPSNRDPRRPQDDFDHGCPELFRAQTQLPVAVFCTHQHIISNKEGNVHEESAQHAIPNRGGSTSDRCLCCSVQ